MNNKEFAITAIKEFARVVVLAIIPVVIDQLTTGIFNLRLVAVVGAIAGLRAIDKALHAKGVLEENDNLTLGITRF